MDVSKFLSKVLGIYLVIIAGAILLNMQSFLTAVTALASNDLLLFVTGFFTLILGILMVVSHNIWQANWRVIITIFSWLALLKGIALIFYPQFITKATLLFVQDIKVAYITALIDFLLGILLCYFGFRLKR